MNLSAKFTLIFSTIILSMGGVSFYGIYSFQYGILEQEITDKLEIAAESHLDKLDRMFYERLHDLDILSDSPAFTSGTSSAQQLHLELDKFLSRYPQYVSATYFNLDRTVITSAGPSVGKYKRHPLTEYWPSVYAGRDHIINISKSAALQIPTLHLADRVIDDHGKTLGILVARVPVTEIYGLMDEGKDFDRDSVKYEADILDRDGTILYSNHNKNAILTQTDEDFGLISEALPKVRSVSSLTEAHQMAHSAENKVLMVFAKEQGYRNFKGNGWILKVVHSSEEAFAPVASLSRKVFIFLFSISLLGIIAILAVLSATVVRPLRKLNSATTLIGQGELDTLVTIESSDEIGKLGQSFNVMAANLRDARGQLAGAAEAALARAHLAERKIIKISEETQQRIGRELHDDLGQQLTGIAFMSEVLRQHLKAQNHPDTENAFRITLLVNEAISKTHKLAHGLYPVEMKESGLAAMLLRLANNTESIYQIECELICEGEPDSNVALDIASIFRIAQEAVHNAVKHSAAKKITLRLKVTADTLIVEVADNGRGIGDPASVEATGGLGMHTMQYRATLLGATLRISGVPGGGTRIILIVPTHGPLPDKTS